MDVEELFEGLALAGRDVRVTVHLLSLSWRNAQAIWKYARIEEKWSVRLVHGCEPCLIYRTHE